MKKIWINGAWADSASGQTIEVTDPATEEVLDTVSAGTPEDVEQAVAAAKAAFPAWRPWSGHR
jgi:aldehyde dehydrogenase (NAD+)